MGTGATTFGPAIHAEVGGVLRNQEKLFDSLRNELFGFATNRLDRAASVFSPHLGNDAEGAGVVTPLGDLDVGEVLRSEAPTGSVEVGDVNGEMIGDKVFRRRPRSSSEDTPDDWGNFLELVEADEGVDFAEFPGQLGGEALGHTTGNNEALIGAATVEAAVAMSFEDGGDAFGFCGIDEGAGVDDQDVRVGGVGRKIDSCRAEVSKHDFGIDEIFRTTERDETDFGGHGSSGGRGMRASAAGGKAEGLRAGFFVRTEI